MFIRLYSRSEPKPKQRPRTKKQNRNYALKALSRSKGRVTRLKATHYYYGKWTGTDIATAINGKVRNGVRFTPKGLQSFYKGNLSVYVKDGCRLRLIAKKRTGPQLLLRGERNGK